MKFLNQRHEDTKARSRGEEAVDRSTIGCAVASCLRAYVPSCLLIALSASVVNLAVGQSQSVVNSPHNLSAWGPGNVRASSEAEVCIFCHAPHNSSNIRPLWNRYESATIYTPYSSSSLVSQPGQPTGPSKLCLSCHDGTIALGHVVSRDQPIHMTGGVTVMPKGRSNLGTDLSDDHPISFRYDAALAMKNGKLVHPSALPPVMRLDQNQELQCTTCHNPHNNIHGNFLVMSNENSAMCRSCHTISTTTIQEHADCANCHQPHSAPSGPHLLRGVDANATCLSCHNGSRAGAQNIAADLNTLSVHGTTVSFRRQAGQIGEQRPLRSTQNSALRTQNSFSHASVACTDCHDPHTMHAAASFAARFGASSIKSQAPYIQSSLGNVSGISASGTPVAAARYEYEVCLKCHGDHNVITSPTINRQSPQMNMRLTFGATAVSAHPVQRPGANNSPSLKPEWRGRMVYCSDCHGSSTGKRAGGTGPDGVHGSNEPGLLIARYETANFTTESPHAYALCYTCHERIGANGVLSDRSFRYHRLHIVDNRTPCSACHDSHGVAPTAGMRGGASSGGGGAMNHAYLMNFDLSIVSPDPITGRLEYQDMGPGGGRCYLSCHGVAHSPKEY